MDNLENDDMDLEKAFAEKTKVEIAPIDREYLKISAKNKFTGRWVEGYLSLAVGSLRIVEHSIINGGDYFSLNSIEENTIRRWSGQYDKDGKKIWEGDVTRHSIEGDFGDENFTYICFYVKELAGFCFLTAAEIEEYNSTSAQVFLEGGDFRDIYTMNAFETNMIKIIGNIYDNPKYLEFP